ncbi:MAG: pentapeptide repeat-containing protein [Oscillatoriales cyanobacterium RM2_1_1]|nr:pentapeptide repeat-containing protein [Oscillatoriales cyanobacterium SM2_3_0]NJO44898.1 pentapeptide repeat-containing protein [Oscillatoriales cyanobacterium RM2_1_1]
MTSIEGLWPQNVSPNRLAVLERHLAIWLRSQNIVSDLAVRELQTLTQQAAAQGCDFLPLQKIIQSVVEAPTENFKELGKLARLNVTADFEGARMLGVDLAGLDLSGASFAGTYFRGANLSDADLSGANFRAANLSGADLSGALLSDTDLTGADLHRVSLVLANLSGANLSQANLKDANLSNSNLSHADLSDAVLINADLHQAGLALTNLSRVDLTGANVSQARLWHDSGLSPEVKQDLMQRGAIFEP